MSLASLSAKSRAISMWYRLIFRAGPLDYAWADVVAVSIADSGR